MREAAKRLLLMAVTVLWQRSWPFLLSSSSWCWTLSSGHSSTRCATSRTPVSAFCIRCCRTSRPTTRPLRASIRRTTPMCCSTSSLLSPTAHILLVSQHFWWNLCQVVVTDRWVLCLWPDQGHGGSEVAKMADFKGYLLRQYVCYQKTNIDELWYSDDISKF